MDAFSHFKQLDTLVLNMHLTAFEGGNSYEKADEYHPSLRSRLRLFPLNKKVSGGGGKIDVIMYIFESRRTLLQTQGQRRTSALLFKKF